MVLGFRGGRYFRTCCPTGEKPRATELRTQGKKSNFFIKIKGLQFSRFIAFTEASVK